MVPGRQSNSIEHLEIFMNGNSNGNIEHQTNRQIIEKSFWVAEDTTKINDLFLGCYIRHDLRMVLSAPIMWLL